MKRITVFMTIFTLLCLGNLSIAKINYEVPESVVDPNIDGVISTGEWDEALVIPISYPDIVTAPKEGTSITGSSPSTSDISCDYYIKWDSQALYIAVDVVDDIAEFTKPSPGPYNAQDAAQFCLNLNNDFNSVFLVDAAIYDFAPETSDGYGPDLYRHAEYIDYDPNWVDATLTSPYNGYVLEVKLEWSAIDSDFFAYPGQVHGAGFMILDRDSSSGSVDSLITDFGSGSNVIDDPTQWNTITLVSEDGCGTQGRLQADINGDCYLNMEDFAVFAEMWVDCTDPNNQDCML